MSDSTHGELAELRTRLAEAEAALAALRDGSADALIGPSGVVGLDGSDKPYLTFFQAMNEGGLTLDGRGHILHCNPRFSRMVGLPIDEVRGCPLLTWVAPEHHADIRTLLDDPAAATCEAALLRGEGESTPVQFSLMPMDLDGHRLTCVVISDLSARVEAERARMESELRLARLMANLPGMAYRCRMQDEWEMMFVSDGAYELTGHPPQDLLDRGGVGYPSLIHPEDREQVRSAHQAALHASESYAFEYRIVTASGATKWVWERGLPVPAAAGEPQTLEGLISDITDKKHAEEQMLLAARVFDRASEAIVVTDPEARILTVNAAFTEVTGYSREEAVGQTPALLKSGKHPAEFYVEMWESLRRNGWWQGEIWNLRKNGEAYLEWLSINSVKDAQGSVLNYIALFNDITLVKESQQRVEFLATHDELTSLPNRTLLDDRLRVAIARAERNDASLAVLFVDLDDFKVINDTLGHEFGDAILVQAAERLRACIRSEDTVARMGGDEFVLLLENADRTTVAITAERVVKVLSRGYQLGKREYVASASVGISLYPDDGREKSTLLRHADTAMYHAKEHGKSAYQFFSREMAEYANERLSMEAGLRHAIRHNEFFVEFQPQVDIVDGTLVAVEALVRWRQGDKVVPPFTFIPVAEESALIVEIDEWVLGEVCRQLRAWDDQGWAPFSVSVNISHRHFCHYGMVPRIRDIVANAGVDARRICLEITEGALKNVAQATATLEELRALGFAISIDDFGTGYSSLAHLKRFPLQELKIARAFISGITDDPHDRSITSAIIDLARRLDLRLVAEGVETAEQLQALRDYDLPINIQGYYFAKPLAAADLEEWIVANSPAALPHWNRA